MSVCLSAQLCIICGKHPSPISKDEDFIYKFAKESDNDLNFPKHTPKTLTRRHGDKNFLKIEKVNRGRSML